MSENKAAVETTEATPTPSTSNSDAKGSGWSFKEWYKDNKASFNEKRRARYHSDPDYKQRVLSMNQDNRARRQANQQVENKQRKKAQKVTATPAWKEVEATILGKNETLLTIGAVAKALGRSAQSIRLYERRGLVPETPHKSTRGDRLYTPAQVLEIYKVVQAQDQKAHGPTKNDLHPVNLTLQTGDVVKVEVAFRVGVLAKASGRTVLTLEQMERQQVLPRTPLRDPASGHRYYTGAMIETVQKAFTSAGGERLRGDAKKAAFTAAVLAGWAAAGVIETTQILKVDKDIDAADSQ